MDSLLDAMSDWELLCKRMLVKQEMKVLCGNVCARVSGLAAVRLQTNFQRHVLRELMFCVGRSSTAANFRNAAINVL